MSYLQLIKPGGDSFVHPPLRDGAFLWIVYVEKIRHPFRTRMVYR